MIETIFIGLIVGVSANLITHYILIKNSGDTSQSQKLKIFDYLEIFAWNILPISYVFLGLSFMPILAIKLIWKILFLTGIFALPIIFLIILNIRKIKTWICLKTNCKDYTDKRFLLSYFLGGLIVGVILLYSLNSGLFPKHISMCCNNVKNQSTIKGIVTNPNWQVYVVFSPKRYNNLFIEKAKLIGSSGEWAAVVNFGGGEGEEFRIIAYSLEENMLPSDNNISPEWIQKNYKYKSNACVVKIE